MDMEGRKNGYCRLGGRAGAVCSDEHGVPFGRKKVIFGLPYRRQPVRFVYFSGVCFSLFGAVRPGVQILSSGGIAAAQVPFRFVLLQNEPHLFIQQPVDLPKTFGQILVFRSYELERFHPSPNHRTGADRYPHSRPCPPRSSG